MFRDKNKIFSESTYVTYTRCLFAFAETVAIAQLLQKGETLEVISDRVLKEDLFQIRSLTSRKSSLRVILKRLNLVSDEYIKFIATENIDLQRFTIFWAILREHRLLREFIREILIEKLYCLDRTVSDHDIKEFFTSKSEQHQQIRSWSKSTYQKTSSHIVSTLVRVGLLYPMQYRKQYGKRYEISPTPIPQALRTQLIADGWENYLILMMDFHQFTASALNTASIGSV